MRASFLPFTQTRTTARPSLAQNKILSIREKQYIVLLIILFGLVGLRLAYWQIWSHSKLQGEAEAQYRRTLSLEGNRGSISTSDGYILATNEPRFKLYAQPSKITTDTGHISQSICTVLQERNASQSASATCASILETLQQKDKRWSYLVSDITPEEKEKLSRLGEPAIGFEEYQTRVYPEASMAAQLLGFVGKNDVGEDVGYFGIEGALNKELQGSRDIKTILTDAFGYQLSGEGFRGKSDLHGRDIVLTIRRDIQHVAESQLALAMELYGAESGEVIILEPTTGKILALANNPTFTPSDYASTDPELYRNRSLVDIYEPGSTFKVLTVAAGINEGVITPNTVCTSCSGPRVFGKYTIRTWNDVYTPNITITQALEKSDNTGMIFIAERLGSDGLRTYLSKFGIGKPIGIDLQGDRDTPFPQKWGPVEMATISFGQGISTTSMQLLRAVAVIANDGKMVTPHIVESIDSAEKLAEYHTLQGSDQIISSESARTVTQMMVSAAEHGEAKWVYAKNFRVAGKTGTSQIASQGGYDETKTIASFIGFSPPENPKFVMLVKLVGPTSSPWAAETAAPLWFKLANRLHLLMHIPYEDAITLPEIIDKEENLE